MKLACFLGMALMTPLALAAQGQGAYAGISRGISHIGHDRQTQTSTVTLNALSPQPNSCPVEMKAQHLSDGDLIKTANRHPRGIGQWLHLVFAKFNGVADRPAATNATLAVRGWTAKPRIASAAASQDISHAVRRIQVTLKPGPDGSVTADLWAQGLTAVDFVDLLSVSYADGSKWTPAAGNRCRVRPDPLMLIAN